MATPPMVPAGWYADPARRHQYRYWDGSTWTAAVANGGVTASDPLEAPPSPVLGPAPGQATPGQPAPGQAAAVTPTAAAPLEDPVRPAEPAPFWQPAAGQPGGAAQQTGPMPMIPPTGQMPTQQIPMQATAGPGVPMPPLPGELWPGATMGTPVTGPPRRKRRGLLFSGIAGVVVLALVVGLVIWAPWKVPPLLRPTGLTAGTVTVSSIAMHWSNPPTGPDPDKYLIIYNGTVIGTVRGNVTTYQTSGLAPDSPYQYRVVAERGGKRSAQSKPLVVHTAIPPVSAARWDGTWTVKVKIVKGQSTINGARKWTESWLATPKCAAGPCTVRMAVELNGHSFHVNLDRSGAVYEGKTKTHVFPCGSGANGFPIKSSLDIKITVGTADVQSGVWTASSWSGTLVVHSPYTQQGNFYCPASSQTATLTSIGGI